MNRFYMGNSNIVLHLIASEVDAKGLRRVLVNLGFGSSVRLNMDSVVSGGNAACFCA